jgi:TonB family protein
MSILSRFLNVFRSKALERELDDELSFHLEQRIVENLQRGMDRNEAESAAHQQFGDITAAREGMREVRMIDRRVVGGFGVGVVAGAAISGAVLFHFYTTTPSPSPILYVGDPIYADLAQADTIAPVLVEERKPNYTPAALRAQKAGIVKMGCIVQTTGRCTDVRVTRSLDPGGLDQEAVKAAKAWRFQPAKRASTPVPYYVTIEMMFNCQGCTPTEYKPLTFNY